MRKPRSVREKEGLGSEHGDNDVDNEEDEKNETLPKFHFSD